MSISLSRSEIITQLTYFRNDSIKRRSYIRFNYRCSYFIRDP